MQAVKWVVAKLQGDKTASFCREMSYKETNHWEFAKGGGAKRIVRFCGGGAVKCTIKCPLQTQFWRPQKVAVVWSVVSCQENDIA